MPLSYAQLKAMLDIDEPDYAALAEKATGAMPHLRKLAASTDVSVASKAVSLAGVMGDAGSIAIVAKASKSRQVLVRIAAAHAASLLPDGAQATRLVSTLLDDKDVGVVKFAARAATRLSDPGLAAKAKRAKSQMDTTVRAMIAQGTQRERTAAMAVKASKKAAGAAARSKAAGKGRSKAAAGQMPTGAMTSSPKKGAKAGDMPNGSMT